MLKIIRWKGGYAGDSILSSILSANKNVLSNMTYVDINNDGRAIISQNENHILYGLLHSPTNTKLLKQNIEQAINDKHTHIVKTHLYDEFLNLYNEHIVDIVSTNDLLSFTTGAIFYKCYQETTKSLKQSNRFFKILEQKDKKEAENYLIYQVSVSHYIHNSIERGSKNKILLDKWLHLQYNDILGYNFDRNIYNNWRIKNEYILNKNNCTIDKICNLVKQEIPYNRIREKLI